MLTVRRSSTFVAHTLFFAATASKRNPGEAGVAEKQRELAIRGLLASPKDLMPYPGAFKTGPAVHLAAAGSLLSMAEGTETALAVPSLPARCAGRAFRTHFFRVLARERESSG